MVLRLFVVRTVKVRLFFYFGLTMHWSKKGAEAMVKIKQGILNQTLREVFLKHRTRSGKKKGIKTSNKVIRAI